MRLTRGGHACVRLEQDGVVIVIDPGSYSDPHVLDGAHAVLVTHEHVDHFAEPVLRAAAEADPDLRIWANRSVADQLAGLGGGRVTVVGDGDTFDIEGIGVEVHGELHAVVHPDLPRVTNVGFLVGDTGTATVFHPGDAFTVPTRPVDTLLLPVHGPWSKTAEVIDYAREIKARTAVSIHDGGLSESGNALADHMLQECLQDIGTDYRRVAAAAGIEAV
ncbi:L-ascorbate metabolism protein UlaG (beta-lactamase superfamily) [Streptomyces sp. SAI-117]|uniref:MBL fold metallo-hydrolase n=1 Tax=unclassified Streptomyces TaxID=2593676 RepID=UPI00247403A8|nr:MULTISPECIES: MBL fold metallo-hydrolase [unclassified Streptomyces]MDH6546132.1 L-ascorbate metabolism protein UlaG (beta-lactamase superfamily) [Streptomyces sp. SAI-041]MDH6565213.1 L-ascorbate metabolism protein UlaG (beta-lactamase superfamily) [Streptomyces sp. SAI-117]